MRPPRAEAARLTAACALATFGIGASVLVGWSLELDVMQRLGLGGIHMLPITAVTFVIAAASLWLQRASGRDSGYWWYVARGLALLVLAIGAVTLAERVFEWDAG